MFPHDLPLALKPPQKMVFLSRNVISPRQCHFWKAHLCLKGININQDKRVLRLDLNRSKLHLITLPSWHVHLSCYDAVLYEDNHSPNVVCVKKTVKDGLLFATFIQACFMECHDVCPTHKALENRSPLPETDSLKCRHVWGLNIRAWDVIFVPQSAFPFSFFFLIQLWISYSYWWGKNSGLP